MNKLISMRFNSNFLKETDEFLKETSFSNRTELFKTAVRKFIDEYETKQALKELKRNYGSGKREGIKGLTPKEFEKIREEVGKESLRKAGLL